VDTSLFVEEEFTMPKSHPGHLAEFRRQVVEDDDYFFLKIRAAFPGNP
jgi:hypothetical protein